MEKECIYLGYLIDDANQLGGWRAMTVHLYYCLKYYYDEGLINIKPVVVRTHAKYKTGKVKTDFGYGIQTVPMTIDELASKKHVLIICVSKPYAQLKKFKGPGLVVHD